MNVSEEQFRWSEFGNKVKRDEAGWFEWMNTKLLAHENDHKGWCGYGGMEPYNPLRKLPKEEEFINNNTQGYQSSRNNHSNVISLAVKKYS